MKKVAILQSNYIPWKGYFDLIAAVDEFILYDDVQYTHGDWRNRNQIKTPQGIRWLTVPVREKGRFGQKIRDAEVSGDWWTRSHWKTLEQNYHSAPHFNEIAAWLRPIYLEKAHSHLSEVNRCLMTAICGYLGIKTKITASSDYTLIDGKTERLADLCRQVGAKEYISGPAAKSYIVEDVFHHSGVRLTWFDYEGYPEYPQLWGEFVHGVSVLDLLFNCGESAPQYMRYVV